MAFIPEDAKWYLAETVQEFQVEDEDTSLVFINFVLIRGDSPEEAYERALVEGKSHEYADLNTDGKRVMSIFRGLHNLHVIHEELEHGSEILYEQQEDVTEAQIRQLVRSKEDLNVFLPHRFED